jgi:hypothetical protein
MKLVNAGPTENKGHTGNNGLLETLPHPCDKRCIHVNVRGNARNIIFVTHNAKVREFRKIIKIPLDVLSSALDLGNRTHQITVGAEETGNLSGRFINSHGIYPVVCK